MDCDIGKVGCMEEGVEFLAVARGTWMIWIFFETEELDGHGGQQNTADAMTLSVLRQQ